MPDEARHHAALQRHDERVIDGAPRTLGYANRGLHADGARRPADEKRHNDADSERSGDDEPMLPHRAKARPANLIRDSVDDKNDARDERGQGGRHEVLAAQVARDTSGNRACCLGQAVTDDSSRTERSRTDEGEGESERGQRANDGQLDHGVGRRKGAGGERSRTSLSNCQLSSRVMHTRHHARR